MSTHNELDKDYQEEVIDTRSIYTGRVVSLKVDTVQMPGGRVTNREVVEHPGAVAIVPLVDENTILLVRQYRHPTGEVLYEIPAGVIEKGEEPLASARRELAEETGRSAGSMEPLVSLFLAPGYSSEEIHLYVARDLGEAHAEADADEFITTQSFPLKEARRMILAGEIKDAKTVAGILLIG